jgi:hypothetical protein
MSKITIITTFICRDRPYVPGTRPAVCLYRPYVPGTYPRPAAGTCRESAGVSQIWHSGSQEEAVYRNYIVALFFVVRPPHRATFYSTRTAPKDSRYIIYDDARASLFIHVVAVTSQSCSEPELPSEVTKSLVSFPRDEAR